MILKITSLRLLSVVLVLLLSPTAGKIQIKTFNILKLFVSENLYGFLDKSQSTYKEV